MHKVQAKGKRIRKDSSHAVLVVEIMRGKDVVKRVELADPRVRYCKTYNELNLGQRAVPAA
jgi:hypothetical protein